MGWAQGLGIPMGGKTILYTGLMYQLMPSMIALGKLLSRVEDSPLVRLFGVGRVVNRYIDGSRFTPLLVSRTDQEAFDGLLRNVALLLRNAGVEFGYLYDRELYAGALAHDEGLCDAFQGHARRVQDLFRSNGVKRIITVDPHTTNVIRSVYPNALGENGVEVKSYLEVLAESGARPGRALGRSVVIHDSCVYARQEEVIEEPRYLLREAGVEAVEPEYSGKMTFCCGGPIESLFPKKARAIADRRVEQLAALGDQLVTMCPICMVNLREPARERNLAVADISAWLE
ncbi:MAG: (Fe-S)-binding protein, partial [Longimicrobiales bacterium]